MRGMYFLLIDSLCISGTSYALSRHKFCLHEGLLTIRLSSVSVAAFFMSCVFAAVITTTTEIMECHVGLSVYMTLCSYLTSLSVGFGPTCQVPPKGDWSIRHIYRKNFSSYMPI